MIKGYLDRLIILPVSEPPEHAHLLRQCNSSHLCCVGGKDGNTLDGRVPGEDHEQPHADTGLAQIDIGVACGWLSFNAVEIEESNRLIAGPAEPTYSVLTQE